MSRAFFFGGPLAGRTLDIDIDRNIRVVRKDPTYVDRYSLPDSYLERIMFSGDHLYVFNSWQARKNDILEEAARK